MPDFIKGTNIEILPHDFGDEPKAVCANCDSFFNGKCSNRLSVWFHFSPQPSDGCERFFPDPKRWPDADHD